MSNQAPLPEIRERVFQRLWGIATIAHLAGNSHGPDIWPDPTWGGVILFLCGVLATVSILRPTRAVFAALCICIPLSAAAEAPFLGNHWLLAAIVSLAWLASGGRWARFENAARLILVTFYSFAAFAKLNAGFLNPETSCGLYYTNQMLTEFGLGAIAHHSPLAWAASWGAAAIELSVVPLLLWSKTRRYGLLLAVGFHGLLTLDLGQHFYDFTSVLFALFVLFAPDGAFERIGGFFGKYRGSRPVEVSVFVVGVATTLGSVALAGAGYRNALADVTFLWWLPFLGAFWWVLGRSRENHEIRWRIGPVALAGVLVVFLNGLTPYLELKTAYGWNMYSNLVVVDGASNHYIVPGGLALRDGHRELIEILESDDPALQSYADNGYLLPWPSFRVLVKEKVGARVVYRRSGELVEISQVSEVPELVAPTPIWWSWFPLRSLHGEVPQRCQTSALPGL